MKSLKEQRAVLFRHSSGGHDTSKEPLDSVAWLTWLKGSRSRLHLFASCHWQTRATHCITTNGKISKHSRDHNYAPFV